MSTTNHSTLWHITRGQRLRYGYAIVAMAATNAFMFGAPLVGKYAIDVMVQRDFDLAAPLLADLARNFGGSEPYFAYLWVSAAAAVLLTGLGGICLYARGRLAALASEAIVRRVREAMYARLHHLRAAYYDDADTGDLVQRASSDVETLRVFLASDVVEIGRAVMLIACVTPILFWMDPRLAWLSLCLMPLLTLGAYLFFARVKAVFQQTDEAEAAMTATLQENLTGIRVVRAFARQDYEIDKFAAKNAAFRDLNHRLIRLLGLYWSTSDLLAMTQMGIVLFAGAGYLMNGSLSIGTLFAF
ncbi:MAG: ABC transporter ATP-binding protein, partial [Gammaproteobacteria bacterium]|nr:ABC transporter ATP-binding protein [Gammaproteobacteria bacterium]